MQELRSILKKPQQTTTTTAATGNETASSENKSAADNSAASLENKLASDNLVKIIKDEALDGNYKVSEDAHGRRIVEYVPKPRIRKTQMRAIKKRNNALSDGDLLLKFWRFTSTQRQMMQNVLTPDLYITRNREELGQAASYQGQAEQKEVK